LSAGILWETRKNIMTLILPSGPLFHKLLLKEALLITCWSITKEKQRFSRTIKKLSIWPKWKHLKNTVVTLCTSSRQKTSRQWKDAHKATAYHRDVQWEVEKTAIDVKRLRRWKEKANHGVAGHILKNGTL
jgi:hypothetical protein